MEVSVPKELTILQIHVMLPLNFQHAAECCIENTNCNSKVGKGTLKARAAWQRTAGAFGPWEAWAVVG